MSNKRTNRDIAREWADRIVTGRAFNEDTRINSNGTFYFIGDTIYSYGSHWPLATVVPGISPSNLPRVYVNTARTSVTTSHHLGLVRRMLSTVCPDVRQIECDGVDDLRTRVEDRRRAGLARPHAS